ncbi:phasin family protein [Sphingomicrobium nitratireducens]|uniref:phasin family protein n=1 Tax=Sphingomicrobium nitratireducens TaxID=2964666 RepID=UPI002240848C|nr:phasin family protein [Sphingomicrobium nitratireducens]
MTATGDKIEGETKIETAKEPVKVAPAKVETPVEAKVEPIKLANPVKKAVRKVNKAAAKTVAAKRKKAAPKAKKPAAALGKDKTMVNMNMEQWFGKFEMPTADKVEEFVAEAGKKGEELIAKSRATTEEMAEIAKANVEALVESGKIAAGGLKAFGADIAEDGREGFAKASDAIKALGEAKTPAEFFELQGKMARAQFDAMVAEGAKYTEQMVKLAGEAMQPVSTRASLNAEKIKALMA